MILRPQPRVRRLRDVSGAGYLVPPTKNPGDLLTSPLWNTYVRDNLDFGMVRPIADVILGSSAASFDFLSIPATFAHLKLLIFARGDAAAQSVGQLLRFNGITSTTYGHQSLIANAATVSASEGLAQSSIYLGDCPAATADAAMFGSCEVTIPYYTSANMKGVESLAGRRSGGSTAQQAAYRTSGFWNGGAANRITLLPASGLFVAGSRVTLYGMGGI